MSTNETALLIFAILSFSALVGFGLSEWGLKVWCCFVASEIIFLAVLTAVFWGAIEHYVFSIWSVKGLPYLLGALLYMHVWGGLPLLGAVLFGYHVRRLLRT